tara:strand:- start:629 stop:1894 length:1266 start_codon:yes stop_codon:yes gene_type:complete
MLNMTEEERITKSKIQLQKTSPFFAHLVMNMDIKESDQVPSMGVNAKGNAIYNKDWIATLDLETIKGVLCHETMHVALLHLLRLGKKQGLIWNIATDIAINWIIRNEGFQLPEEGIIPDQRGWVTLQSEDGDVKIRATKDDGAGNMIEKTADELYEELLDKLPECKCGCHSGKGKGGKGTSSTGHCCPCQGNYGFDEHQYGDDMNNADQEATAKEWRGKLVDAATAAKARGKLPGGIARIVDELLNPKLDWRTMLYQYITKDIPYDFSMRKPGRRSYSTGVYLPEVIKENLDICCTVDTSGSISKEEYREFATELMSIANSFQQIKMNIIYWDTEVTGEIDVSRSNKEDILDTSFLGGGGTEMSCLGRHFYKKQPPKLMVHLTDGFIERDPDLPSCKHLFVIPKHGTGDRIEKYGPVADLK